jgi:hypothetical protein
MTFKPQSGESLTVFLKIKGYLVRDVGNNRGPKLNQTTEIAVGG